MGNKGTVSPAEYKSTRKERGTQKGVAALLGVDYRTIQRREAGEIEITREAELAAASFSDANGVHVWSVVASSKGTMVEAEHESGLI
jgi:hypothetical protein